MMKKILFVALAVLAGGLKPVHAADTVRVCTYNVLQYSASNEDGRIPQYARILMLCVQTCCYVKR